jgi:hypothetical protein
VSSINKERFVSIQKLVLDEAKIPADLQLFRASEYPAEILVRKELAEAIDAAQIQGPRWIDPLQFPE